MSDNLDKYLPEFDETEIRSKLTGFTREELLDMLVYAYKEKRVLAKAWDEDAQRLSRIKAVLAEPSNLLKIPGVPTVEDLRRMADGEQE